MHAASREALETVSEYFDTTSKNKEKPVAVAAQTGAELFDVVELLDGDRALRITIAEASLAEEQRAEVVSAVFAGKVSQYTLELLIMASSPGVVDPEGNAHRTGDAGTTSTIAGRRAPRPIRAGRRRTLPPVPVATQTTRIEPTA